ncbi:tRNA (adenosine(37)-N6)-threonylcarbamoyltransferase complex dimerization subunit type 1 TsaB [Enterococcus sp. LJL90]
MITLGIDTANQPLAVGLIQDGKILGETQTAVKKNHSLTLMPAIEELTAAVGLKPAEIDRIGVAQGPGSYTGLRIGVTIAKTLAYTLKKELVGISSLKIIAANCHNVKGWLVPLFDARRENVYAGIYQWQQGELIEVLADQHIALAELLEKIPPEQEVYFVGIDTEKFLDMLQGNPLWTINPIAEWDLPRGTVAAALAAAGEPVTDIHGFLPDYLKRVEAEENWLKTHHENGESYVEKI